MLMLSDLLEVARGGSATVTDRSGLRFSPAAPAAPVVVWNVCRHCNMTCPHCYVAAGARPSPSDLTTRQARAVLEDLADNGVKIVIFSGGEPLLRGDLFELLAHARDRGISPQLSSNGVLIDASVAARLSEVGVAYVGVSIDGLAWFNDGYRGLEGAFERALAGLRHSRAAGLRTGLRMTVTRRNVEHLPALIDLAVNQGIHRFYVSHLVYAGRGRQMAADDVTPAEARLALYALFVQAETLLDEGRPLRIVTGSNDSDAVLFLHWVRGRHGEAAALRVERLLRLRGGNSAGEKLLAIDHRGRVHPDQFWQSEVLGTLPGNRFEEILRHPLRAQLADRTARLTGRCGACRFKAMCRGSHRERALAATGEMWGPDPACVMTDAEIGLHRAEVAA